MSRAKRQQRRRDDRATRKEQAAKGRQWTLPQAVAELGDEDIGGVETWLDPDPPDDETSPDAGDPDVETLLDPDDPDVQKFAKTGMKSTVGKWELLRPIAIRLLRRCIRDADILEPYERLLRGHPGVPSPLEVEAFFLAGMMSAWANTSFLVRDFTTHLASLAPEIAFEVGAVTEDGTPGMVYRTTHKQFTRLLEALRAEAEKGGEVFDTNWLERRLLPVSVPSGFCETVEAVAVDETAAQAWHVERCKKSQKKVNKEVRCIFRERYPNMDVPEMSSPVMRAIAAERGRDVR